MISCPQNIGNVGVMGKILWIKELALEFSVESFPVSGWTTGCLQLITM